MRKNQFLSNLLATTFICGAASFATPALAQGDQPAAGAAQPADQEGQEVVITGSRIPQPNLTAVSPVTVINSQEIRLQGVTRTEDLINSLPQVFAGQGGNLANGATGTATVDLRGLGPERTLVLINGRRLVPGDPSTARPPDINVIPAAIVSRVDVLTGGASSVYGADAVAGVVNFIMDTEFEGVRVDGQYSFYQHNNRVETQRSRHRPGRPRRARLRLSGAATSPTAARSTSASRSAPASTTAAAMSSPMPATARSNAVTQGRRDYSAPAPARLALAAQVAGQSGPPRRSAAARPPRPTARHPVRRFGVPADHVDALPDRPEPHARSPGFTPYNFAPTNYYPASRRALHRRRLRRITRSADAAALPRVHVHGRPHGRPDRPVGQLRQHAAASTATAWRADGQCTGRRQPAALRAAARASSATRESGHPDDRHGLSAGRHRRPGQRAAGVHRSRDGPALLPRLRPDPAPQRRRRRPPRRPAAHQLSASWPVCAATSSDGLVV